MEWADAEDLAKKIRKLICGIPEQIPGKRRRLQCGFTGIGLQQCGWPEWMQLSPKIPLN
jgi:hypothetical protein